MAGEHLIGWFAYRLANKGGGLCFHGAAGGERGGDGDAIDADVDALCGASRVSTASHRPKRARTPSAAQSPPHTTKRAVTPRAEKASGVGQGKVGAGGGRRSKLGPRSPSTIPPATYGKAPQERDEFAVAFAGMDKQHDDLQIRLLAAERRATIAEVERDVVC